jgi:hypothetical protein
VAAQIKTMKTGGKIQKILCATFGFTFSGPAFNFLHKFTTWFQSKHAHCALHVDNKI